ERQLWIVFERRRQLSRDRVSIDPAGKFYENPVFGILRDDVQRHQRAVGVPGFREGVFVGLGDEHRALDGDREQRRRDFDGPQLGVVRAAFTWLRFDGLPGEVRLGATTEPNARGGVDREAFRQRYGGVLQLRLRHTARGGETFVVEVQVEVQAAGR